jgi:hypothetical protein
MLYWKSPINLRYFNQLSQDLVSSRHDIWKADGCDTNNCNDMVIEFSESPHSHEEIPDLGEEATGLFNGRVMMSLG